MYNFKKESNTGHIASRHPLSQDAGQIKQKQNCPVKYGTGGNPVLQFHRRYIFTINCINNS